MRRVEREARDFLMEPWSRESKFTNHGSLEGTTIRLLRDGREFYKRRKYLLWHL
jgi:hypothetical protein